MTNQTTNPASVPAVVSLVTLGVRDLPASTAFYRQLGFPLSSASVEGEVSFFRTAGGLLGLYGLEALAADGQVTAPAAAGFRGSSLAVNVGSREAVDAAAAVAERAGARITKSPQATEWGGYHCYFTDPDDHLWEVAHNPFWPLRADGTPELPE
jgi:catechol 2,3-dioxygenase-like lactoylglutathione lyase family enzyme